MPEGLRHVEHAMGTVFSFDVRTPATPEIRAALAEAVAWLHDVDERFSPFRRGSEISRLDRGETTVGECTPDVAEVLSLCAEVAQRTGGWFSVTATGRLDPSALVKGWAIERAASILRSAGAEDLCVNGGGDIQTYGEASPGRQWNIGITDPRDRTRLLTSIEGRNLAVATSGTYERGAHIRDPHTGCPAHGLLSLTLAGRDLTTVDALSTALFAMGGAARDWLAAHPGLTALAVTAQGDIWTT
ncbi:FAD:protein FMN transferase [Actinocorallia aurea]